MVVIHLLRHITPKLKQPSAFVPLDCPRSKNLRDGTCGLRTPDLKLEEPVSGSAVTLREEKVVFRLCIDVRDSPSVLDDLYVLFQPGNNESLGILTHHRMAK